MKKAIYPGSFDPITYGHLDVLRQALDVFDEVIILVADNPNKKYFFDKDERVSMIKDAVKGIKGVKVASTNGLTVDFAKKEKTFCLVRGLRNATDYNYETRLLASYRSVEPKINSVFFVANEKYSTVSSSKVNKLFKKKKDISIFVPNSVIKMYKKR